MEDDDKDAIMKQNFTTTRGTAVLGLVLIAGNGALAKTISVAIAGRGTLLMIR